MSKGITSLLIKHNRRTGVYTCLYARPSCYGGNWHTYQSRGQNVEFTSWDDAFKWLVDRNNGNVARVLIAFCDEYVQEQTVAERAEVLYGKH